MPEFELHTTIQAPSQACFDLSLSVDAHRESMGDSGEQAVAGVTSGHMALGDAVTWRARHFGLPFTMTSSITAYDAPHRFVDEQVSGPFKEWWHEHTFEATPDGGTHMTDRVRFRAPLGPLGSIAETLALNRYLPRLLEERNAWLKATLESV
ncbi:hypothetical protein JNB_17918 [Janibacter sp. HTCC2649]|uniref:SRPBCC family protein n=1 Tax=Janibacter sp. HTCC2649 TaxID=313589 RepID=UPI0000671006|nr:SRPBCC family protein [Janibacter sp. HTCC2649]EAP97372.1 hypothetical protein JNB_17918 [Janibacter sp. HTCC2649]